MNGRDAYESARRWLLVSQCLALVLGFASIILAGIFGSMLYGGGKCAVIGAAGLGLLGYLFFRDARP